MQTQSVNVTRLSTLSHLGTLWKRYIYINIYNYVTPRGHRRGRLVSRRFPLICSCCCRPESFYDRMTHVLRGLLRRTRGKFETSIRQDFLKLNKSYYRSRLSCGGFVGLEWNLVATHDSRFVIVKEYDRELFIQKGIFL